MSGLSPKVIMESKCFVENFVAQEFAASKRGPLYCWEEKKCEIEFLLEIDGEVIPVEVKSGLNAKANSLKLYSQKYKPPFGVVLSGHAYDAKINRGVRYYPLYLAGFFP